MNKNDSFKLEINKKRILQNPIVVVVVVVVVFVVVVVVVNGVAGAVFVKNNHSHLI